MIVLPPCAALRDRVVHMAFVENDGGELAVLPTTGAVLGFQFHGRVRAGEELLSPAGVTGIQKSARNYGYVGPTASLLVRFTPQGAACLGVPASELANHSVPLDVLIAPARARQTRERLLDAQSAEQRAAIVEQLLLELPFTPDPVIERALGLLESAPDESASIARVARSVSLSERQLERRFLERVGTTPKRFSSLRRFERAVALVKTAPSLTRAALDAGYYDQSHFIREVRRFSGATPGQLRVREPEVSDLSNPG